jgi:hypothetical protein
VRSKDTTCNTKRRRSYFVIVKNFIKVDLQSDAFRVIQYFGKLNPPNLHRLERIRVPSENYKQQRG